MSQCSKKNCGFSITELLVSLGIVLVLLSLVAFNQQKYTDTSALVSLADEFSLTVTQAQAYGVAVKERAPGSADFSASYGISLSLLGSGSNIAYLFFSDRNVNKYYDGAWDCPVGGTSECLEKANISRGNYIDSICVVRTNGADQCNTVSRVDISFVRPDTEAQLVFFNNGGQVTVPQNMKGVRIVFKSPSNVTRSVVVYQTGQISVQ